MTKKKIPVKLFISQIPKNWGEEDARNFFSNFGTIKEVQIIFDQKNNHRGCVFVTFSSITEADIAIETLNEVFFLPGATAKLQLKWADGEAKKLGLQNISVQHANKLVVTNIPTNQRPEQIEGFFS